MESGGDWSLSSDPGVRGEGGDSDGRLPDERGVHVLLFSVDRRKQDSGTIVRYDIAVPVAPPSAPRAPSTLIHPNAPVLPLVLRMQPFPHRESFTPRS